MTDLAKTYGGAALVTGASAGIGEAFARALAARKMDLVLVARRKDRLEALAKELEAAHGVKTLAIAQDLGEPGAAAAVRAAVEGAGLSVGLLVNNAGFGGFGPFEGQDPARDEAMVDLNCRAPVALTHAFLPGMLERKRGGIVFVASLAGYQPTPYFAVYGATKAFDLMLAEALWAELSPRGIAVLGLSPGLTQTEFQAVAGSGEAAPGGAVATPAEVVETALAALGRQPSVIDGTSNWLLATSTRFAPRSWVARLAARMIRPKAAAPLSRATPPTVSTGGFQREVVRMLLTFVAVVAIDLAVLSLFSGRFRFWFPVWLDPAWASRGDPWVVYSQSYFAGIFLIPVLARAISREFLSGFSAGVRGLYWGGALGALGFIGWWKGGLMVEFGKQREAVGWLALSALVYSLVVLAGSLPRVIERWSRGALLRRLAFGVSAFFLVMAVVDPLLQIGVQRLPWSSGLVIEVGFFVPAGLLLLFAARRFGARAAV
ncbi:MAG: SDR family NAD(P)-dependent oxidoreductase [Myxococcaceae bacterium]